MRRWNDDPFTKKAKAQNFAARSVFKLEEIDRREKILRGAKLIIDLGAAPGSWTQYCLQQSPQPRLIAVDIAPMRVNHPNLTFLEQAIENVDWAQLLKEEKADVVLSDMAPKTSGIHDRDVALSFELASLALATARAHLRPGGAFVVKLFMGGSFEAFQRELKACFQTVGCIRPESTRKHSREVFFAAKGLRK